MITLFSIIGEEWNSPIDANIEQIINENEILKMLKFSNPFEKQEVNLLVGEIEEHLRNRKISLLDNNILEAYKELHWFTTYQVNLGEYLNYFKNLKNKQEMMNQYIEEVLKNNAEKSIKALVTKIYSSKEEELNKLVIENNADKKLTSSENKFFSIKLQNIEDKYDSKLAPYTGNKLNYTIQNAVKTNNVFLELQRKQLILEKIYGYFEIRFKTFQEEINTHKKIIDNLIFLSSSVTR